MKDYEDDNRLWDNVIDPIEETTKTVSETDNYDDKELDAINVDAINEYDDKVIDAIEEEVQETTLPADVRNFEKVATSFSRYNNLPAILGYYSILGDIVKHMVEIPFKKTTTDTRVHICDIQTARSGKSTLINYVLKPVTEEIYKQLNLDNKILNIIEYTTASLVGAHIENSDFKEQAENILQKAQETLTLKQEELDNNMTMDGNERVIRQNSINEELYYAIENYDLTKDKWIIDYGPLHGEGIWFADEFENSGIFEKRRSHKEGIFALFQNMVNNIHNGSNQYEKSLTGKPIIILDSKYTITAWTYPPENLYDVIVKKGILQRFLLYVWDVEDDILTDMRKEVLSGWGSVSETIGPPLELAENLIEIYKLLEQRFESVGRDKLKTITYHPAAVDALEMEHRTLLRYIDNLPNKTRSTIRLFEMNLMEYISKLAVLNCISMAKGISNPNERFIVHPQNVRQAAWVVRKCYTTLIDWLECQYQGSGGVTKNSKLIGLGKKFRHAYGQALKLATSSEKRNENYVHKNIFMDQAGKLLGCSSTHAYRLFKEINQYFEWVKDKRAVYIRPKQEE